MQTATDVEGLARAIWQLGKSGLQQVTAELIDSAKNRIHLPVIFNAQFTQGEAADPGIHVKAITLINGSEFHNDREVPVNLLANGVRIDCDDSIAALSVHDQPTSDSAAVSPTVFVTLDLPYPFNSADIQLWNEPVIAYQPVILASKVYSDGNSIYWGPTDNAKTWLTNRLFQMMRELKRGDRIRAHLTLKGNYIWNEKQDLHLDGEVFGMEGHYAIGPLPALFDAAKLPSGDKRAGGDLEMWFWLKPPEKRVVLLGNPALAPFKPLSATRIRGLIEAVSLALDRPALRGVVPPEYQLDMTALFDVPAAQALSVKHKLQRLKFRAWSGLPLADAGQLVSKMVAPLGITMSVEERSELWALLQTAVAAGEAPESVQVDAAQADRFAELGYTFVITTL